MISCKPQPFLSITALAAIHVLQDVYDIIYNFITLQIGG